MTRKTAYNKYSLSSFLLRQTTKNNSPIIATPTILIIVEGEKLCNFS